LLFSFTKQAGKFHYLADDDQMDGITCAHQPKHQAADGHGHGHGHGHGLKQSKYCLTVCSIASVVSTSCGTNAI
jgi:hypothetical protein